jgi:serralysin
MVVVTMKRTHIFGVIVALLLGIACSKETPTGPTQNPNPNLGPAPPVNAPAIQMCLSPPIENRPDGDVRVNAVGNSDCKWEGRSSLNVAFLDGDPSLRSRVQAAAQEWTTYSGISFNFVSGAGGDIRISFERGGSWSYYGKCGPSSGKTMNYGWLTSTSSAQEVQRVVLHEFGHALGLVHEHANPSASIPWDVQAVYAHCTNNLGWDRAMCEHNFFSRPASTNYTQFDPLSIMVYAVDDALTIGNYSVPQTFALSATDKAFIASWYASNASSVPISTIGKFNNSGVRTYLEATARTEAEWRSLWQLHAPDAPLPTVDFSTRMVLGVFLGTKPSAGFGVEITGVRVQGNVMTASVIVVEPAPGSVTASVITRPGVLVSVPRHTGSVAFVR